MNTYKYMCICVYELYVCVCVCVGMCMCVYIYVYVYIANNYTTLSDNALPKSHRLTKTPVLGMENIQSSQQSSIKFQNKIE